MDELTSVMQVVADENLLAIIMDNIDNPKTLLNLIMVLPSAKVTFEHFPKQFLTATLSGLPSDLEELVILYIVLTQDHPTRASMVTLLRGCLRTRDTTDLALFHGPHVDLTIPTHLCDPIETLRKLASVWNAVEDLTSGFVECSIKFIEDWKVAQAAGLATEHYERGHKLRPLSHLWDHEITLGGSLPGHRFEAKPQPWSLPLRASELHRIKRAFWRLEILATLSHGPDTLLNESAVGSTTTPIYCADTMEKCAIPQDDEEGTRIFFASLRGFELAELDSVYDYLWRETIGKVHQDETGAHTAHYKEKNQQAQSERKAGTTSHGVYQWSQRQSHYQAPFARHCGPLRVTKDHNRYPTCHMSLELPFLQRIHQQMTQDGAEIVPKSYPPHGNSSFTGLRGMWNDMNTSTSNARWRSYTWGLVITRPNREADPSEIGPGVRTASACAVYLGTRSARQFLIGELWRAGCYMWEGGR